METDSVAMKIRGKGIDDILEFVELEHDGKLDLHKNTNEQEANEILNRVLEQLDAEDYRSVAVITLYRATNLGFKNLL